MTALRGNFPARNRIIAGMSAVTVVLQAAQESGALITARYALEYGRDVAAVPGSFDDELSYGCHELIANGAFLASSGKAICDLLGITGSAVQQERVVCPIDKTCGDSPVDQVLMYLRTEALSIDELCERVGIYELSVIHEKLFQLQIDGCVTQDIMGRWCATGEK